MSTAPRVAIVHIGKTGGIWLKSALRQFYDHNEVCKLQFELQYPENLDELNGYKLFDSHIGYDVASRLNAKLITMLRNPLDRIVSLYYYWLEVPETTGGPGVAKSVSFEDFISGGIPNAHVEVNTWNAQTWQIAFGTTMCSRKENADISPDDLLGRAIRNLENFDVVGVTEAIPKLAKDIERKLGLTIDPALRPQNSTKSRPKLGDIGMSLRDRMYPLINLDLALYQHVLGRYVLR